MTAEEERGKRIRKRLVPALAVIVALLLLLFVPPYVSISRYKSRITQLLSSALGRPVRLSSVELRLLPRPGFLISDLTVQEDPAFGAEPVLHASTVVASVRLLSLWRGRLELSSISIDEASLNLVRNDQGRWNLDSVFSAASSDRPSQDSRSSPPYPPYLEATNSRINVKKGIEKLPYSLVSADLSFWQEGPGDWRVRLRGQPSRTDVSLDLADTGIVRLEGRIRKADTQQMLVHLDLDWREAQLGQLSRLVVGSDPGWRGDLTGEMQIDGTTQSAQVKARLTASGVHRAEFAPPEPLDFDANCRFVYHHFDRSVEKAFCDSPLGDGHIMFTGELPADRPAKFSIEAQRVPASAGLDVLRTLRSGFNSDLEAAGTISGRIAYDPSASAEDSATPPDSVSRKRRGNVPAKEATSSLSGGLTLDGLRLSGGGLGQPIQLAKPVTLQPGSVTANQPETLSATIPIPAGGPSPLTVVVQAAAAGYQATIHGPASIARMRELAHVAGVSDLAALDGLAGDPALLDLHIQGPWLPAAKSPNPPVSANLDGALALHDADSDQLAGTLTLHNANWRSEVLANHVQIAQAVLHLGASMVWDPIDFSYGPLKGTASFQPAPSECPLGSQCAPQLDLHFTELDTAQLQAALLGAKQQSSGISALIARFSASSAPPLPHIVGTVHVDALRIGPLAIDQASASVQTQASELDFTNVAGNLFSGELTGTGKMTRGDKPSYTFEGQLEKGRAPEVCRLFSLRCDGGSIDAQGRVELSGFTDKDLGSSASGAVHFEWRHGALLESSTPETETPKALARFDRWTADAKIGDNGATLTTSEVSQGSRTTNVDAAITFADEPVISWNATSTARPAKH